MSTVKPSPQETEETPVDDARPVERDGQRDDWGVEAGSRQQSVGAYYMSSMVDTAVGGHETVAWRKDDGEWTR